MAKPEICVLCAINIYLTSSFSMQLESLLTFKYYIIKAQFKGDLEYLNGSVNFINLCTISNVQFRENMVCVLPFQMKKLFWGLLGAEEKKMLKIRTRLCSFLTMVTLSIKEGSSSSSIRSKKQDVKDQKQFFKTC